ncbi:MAG: AAA family ATPase, partial [Acidobacteriota bacterium]|nr:AAA family ATPase [Acidobacteriota bacterium]
AKRCTPQLPEAEVEKIAQSVTRYEPDKEIGAALPEGDLFTSWGVMSLTAYVLAEYIIYGLCRGDVGMLQAVTNYGKSTLLRNLAVALACGKAFMTLADTGKPLRVLLLDYETAFSRYVQDLNRMTTSLGGGSQALVKQNLHCYVAKKRNSPYLNLSEPDHFSRLVAEALAFQPDIIIVDTVTAGFSIKNENDNSEITNAVMKPLTQLAVEANAALLFAHHIGKIGSEEGGQSNGSYRARGASAFEGMAAASIQLDAKKNAEGNRVLVLDYKKIKDEQKPSLVLELNKETRWFEVREGEEAIENTDENYRRMLALITRPIEAKDISSLAGFLSETTRKRYLNRALKEGRLEQPRRGLYQPVDYIPFDQSEMVA